VGLEMLGQTADPLGQDSDLNFRRTGVLVVYLKATDQLLLGFLGNAHKFLLLLCKTGIYFTRKEHPCKQE
jgi:hypothetical protein